MKLVIPGTLPGLNEYTKANRTNKYVAAKFKREAEGLIGYYANRAKRKSDPVIAPVTLHYTWYEPNKKRDKDNIAFARKFIQDALVSAGILENDGWAQIEGFSDSFEVDKANPRVEVEIREAQ